MEEYKTHFKRYHKLHSLVACTLSNPGEESIRELIINNSYISAEATNGLHMMSGTYLYTNPPPYGYGSPAPYVAASVNRAYSYNRKTKGESEKLLNGHKIIDAQIHDIDKYPSSGIVGNFHPSIVWKFSQLFLIKNYDIIREGLEHVINFLKTSNSDVLSKGRQTWDPETFKSTTCSKAFNNFLFLIKRNLGKTPSTLIECLIYWYEMYNKNKLIVRTVKTVMVSKKRYVKKLKMRMSVASRKIFLSRKTIIGSAECNRWLDDYARSFCSYIKHAERGKMDRRAIASGSIVARLHLRVIEELHLQMAKNMPGNTISIGGEEKKKKIINELQMSSLKEGFRTSYSLQGTEDASKWNECMNPLMFAMVHQCWIDDDVRMSNGLPKASEEEKSVIKICLMGFYYLLVKRINLGIGFLLENEDFYNRMKWSEINPLQLNVRNREWFDEIKDKLDKDDYVQASPGFLMGMLNACSTTIGLIAVGGVSVSNTIIRSLRSSDDSMTVFVADSIQNLASLISLVYSVYRLFGINPSKEKSILFPEGYGEYTSWFQDGEFVGQYGVETSSLKPIGANPQDDFNAIAANTLQLMRTQIINVFGAISRIVIGCDNVRRLWNIKENEYRKLKISEGVRFLADGGRNPWCVENLAVDEATIRYNKIETADDKKYFLRVMNPNNPFSEPSEEKLLYSKDIGILVASDDNTPRNVFCYVRRTNRTNKDKNSIKEAEVEKFNQEAFEIATSIDPSFLLTIPCSKTPLNKYLASTITLVQEKFGESLSGEERLIMCDAIEKLSSSRLENEGVQSEDEDAYDNL